MSTYKEMWDSMYINCDSVSQIETLANKLKSYKWRYEEVAKKIGCPWYFIAVTHYRESSVDFKAVLHNGEKIIGTGKKTKLVPKGRGPFSTWEDSAIDALKLRKLDKVEEWDIETLLSELEKYNGLGYKKYHPEVPSPYLWSKTCYYVSGKYASDGKFDKNLVDKQIGCAPILKFLI